MINLHKNIKEQYEIEALKQLCLWERNVLRASSYRNHRISTLKCISHNLTPVSIKPEPTKSKHKISTSAKKIIERAERQLCRTGSEKLTRLLRPVTTIGTTTRVEHESLSLTAIVFCEREKSKVLSLIQQNDKSTQESLSYLRYLILRRSNKQGIK